MENELPFELFADTWRIYNIPVDLNWWRQLSVEKAQDLCRFNENNGRWLAAYVAAALEQVTSWMKSGLKVKGRVWVDVGGGHGHFSIALKLLGAKSVTLVDPRKPDRWTEPVCSELGIKVVNGDGKRIPALEADSALLLYVPDVGVQNVLCNHPLLTQLITDDTWLLDDWFAKIDWQENILALNEPFWILGDDNVVINTSSSNSNDCVRLLCGPPITRPMPVLCLEGFETISKSKINRSLISSGPQDLEKVPF